MVDPFRLYNPHSESTLVPELFEKTARFHFIEKAAVDEIFGFDLLGARIHTRDFIEDRLQPLVVQLQVVFQNFHLAVVGGIENFAVGQAKIFAENFVDKLLVRVDDLSRFRHGAEKLAQHVRPFGDERAAGEKHSGGVGQFELGSIDDVMKTAREGLGIGGGGGGGGG